MTPMQMLKNNFLSLSERLGKFEEINLKKSQPKDTWVQNLEDEYALCFPEEQTNFSHFTKKGVKSDFIIESITVSNELIRLRNIAQINQETCAHMFRHRFITNMFIHLIKQYDLENKDSI